MPLWKEWAKDLEPFVGEIVYVGSRKGVLVDPGTEHGIVTLDLVDWEEKKTGTIKRIDLRRVNSLTTPRMPHA